MGYLDHSTNNIILDAVLTDYGRQKLANGSTDSFLANFSLGDDEVDYKIIKKYGRTVGKEKIEKNTPIFEALTNPDIAIKYKLIGRETGANTTSISGIYLPYLKYTGGSSIDFIASSNEAASRISAQIQLFYNGAAASNEYAQNYQLKVSDRFFSISGTNLNAGTILNPSDPNKIKTYTTTNNSTVIDFTVSVKSIDKTTLSIYGKRINSGNSTRKITSYITISGNSDGSTLDIPITYTASL